MPEVRAIRSKLAPLAAATFAAALTACTQDWNTFTLNPMRDFETRSAEYNFFYRRDGAVSRQITAADLVGPDGRCAYEAPPMAAAPPPGPAAAPPPPAAEEQPVDPRSNRALYFTAGPEAGPPRSNIPPGAAPPEIRSGPPGVALSMSECDVVRVIGPTQNVQIGNEGGRRVVVMTYLSGDRPGIYRFTDGRLSAMDRVEAPAPPPRKPAKKTKTAKKTKPAT